MMQNRFELRPSVVLAASLALVVACAYDDPATPTEPLSPRVDREAWILAFSDEFDANHVDAAKWFAWSGDLRHKNTMNAALPSLATVRHGSMFVSAAPSPENKAFPYSAGYVDTHGLFAQTYGKIEFRARAQYAPGVWYALWGRSWTNLVPEIDIELLAENTTQAWFVNHWGVPPLPADERRGFTTVNGIDITAVHTYSIIWTPDLVEWQIDGEPYRRVSEPAQIPHEPMFWVMNAWVGGWGGTPGPSTRFPATLEVEYLRVYRMRSWSVPPRIRVADPRTALAGADALAIELADFGPRARVEVWEGVERVVTLPRPPFRLQASVLSRGAHALTIVGTDGERTAKTSLDLVISR